MCILYYNKYIHSDRDKKTGKTNIYNLNYLILKRTWANDSICVLCPFQSFRNFVILIINSTNATCVFTRSIECHRIISRLDTVAANDERHIIVTRAKAKQHFVTRSI